MSKHVVAAVGEIPPGTRKLAEVNGRSIVVFNLGGEFFALSNRCPHRAAASSTASRPASWNLGRARPLLLFPPGRDHPLPLARLGVRHPHRPSWCDPRACAPAATPVSVQPGTRVVAGPYVAETVPVTVEGDYVVVEA